MFALGCSNPFALREGEEPTESFPIWWRQQTTPQNVLANLVDVYELQQPEFIADLLTEDHVFEPDPQDVIETEGKPALTFDEEVLVTRVLLDTLTSYPILQMDTLAGISDEDAPQDTVTLRRVYTLELGEFPFAGGVDELVAEGTSAFRMRQDSLSGEWRIWLWRDRRGEVEWSWGRAQLEVLGGG